MKIKDILINVIGPPNKQKGNEYIYYCPFCKHHKPKLQVNIVTGKWHCWVCENTLNSKGNSVYSFLVKLGCNDQNLLSKAKLIKPAKLILNNYVKKSLSFDEHFLPAWKKNNNHYFQIGLKYLTNTRHMSMNDIMRYNIHIAVGGYYSGRIIIPSYNANNELEYFVARSFINHDNKYDNPPLSKDIIYFENTINWNFPVILCEGVFDAMEIGFNAIPLLGKTLSMKLFNKLLFDFNNRVYLCLDSDAKKNSINICEELYKYGVEVYYCALDKKDPSSMGRVNFWEEVIPNAIKIDESNIYMLKMGMQLNLV